MSTQIIRALWGPTVNLWGEFETASFTAYDWRDYFGMAIQTYDARVEISDAYNYGDASLKRRRIRK